MPLAQFPGTQLISNWFGSEVAPAPVVAPTPLASDCSIWDFNFNKPAWDACLNAAGVAQIESVPQNAAYYYGADSLTAQVARQAAAQQEAQVPLDTANISQFYGAGKLFATAGPQGATTPTWAIAALLVGAFLLMKNM